MTQALLSAVGAPGSLRVRVDDVDQVQRQADVQLGRRRRSSSPVAAPPALVGAARPVTSAMPPGPDWHIVSCLFVPFSSFSIDSWRRLVMIIVFTDDLICAMRAR